MSRIAIIVLLAVPSLAHAQAEPVSFLNEVVPLLTRLGCNQGACHGKLAGQNGFRLSLRGYAPEWDHDWLTREYTGRRINNAVPEASLLLRKPLGEAPHEGGKLLAIGSREHRTLLEWIRQGTPGPKKGEAEVRELRLSPGSRVLGIGQEQQLQVTARFSDGHERDVTWLCQFFSNDSNAAAVTPAGLVKMVRPGETAIRASFLGQVAVVVLTAPYDQQVKAEWYAGRNNVIDDHVFKKLHDLRIPPSEACDDATFIRRVYLDTIGVLPTPAEIRAFVADRAADKRGRLVDRLLDRPEFVDFWALQLGDLLQNRKESDHDVRGTKGVRDLHEWLRRQVKDNRPWDQTARDLLTVQGATTEQPGVGYFVVTVGEQRDAHQSEVVASVAQTFLGTRIGCARCHNHPSEKYTQDDYYHFAGFFSRIRMERKDPKQGATVLAVSASDPNQNKNPVGVLQPRTHKFLKPQPLDRSQPDIKPGDDPRRQLVRWMTEPGNPHFAGAMVNRLWAHFFNVGLVEPVDDIRASNPPSNPELWKALVAEFVKSQFDRKHMIRLMVNSRAYQLASETKPGNDKERRFYSHYYARRLPAEVFLDAVSQATGVPERFDGYPVGIRAVQVPDPTVKSHFLSIFGRSERITPCACERNNDVTLPQLLHLQGGSTLPDKIRSGDGRLAALMNKKLSDRELAEELSLATFSRLPRPQELAALDEILAQNAGGNRDEVYLDYFWALLNAREFAFNH
ncbi:MAG: DUF1549 domain-containing protein [Planctomycetes bacterium]|nr:DUF1549 domain-containing protein [Planctomycetota bacterium]